MDKSFRLMPEQASSIAPQIDALYYFLILISTVMSVLIAFLIIYFAIKYRRGSAVDRTQGAHHFYLMEIAWIVGPFVVVMVIFFWSARLYFAQARAPAGAMEINCVAKQWMWKFQHPQGNTEINDLHVPLGQPVKIRMISEDVIHSLYIPAFRVKQDVLPGRYTTIWFEATKVGQYHLFCAEYCGAKHSEMRGRVIVLEPSQYEAWLAGREVAQPPEVAGRRLFDQLRCNSCHVGSGMAGRCPPLDNLYGSTVRLQNGQTVLADETYIRESILRPTAKVVAGFQPLMPSYEGQISEEGILQLIAEIKSMSPRASESGADEVKAKEGQP
ncbi:MAG TPA: cytochrome c oxidase subunit II [Pirellulaceae bacterium]|nr:cytochrome c oxidase subunit II [Pirellulaceae bacterium]